MSEAQNINKLLFKLNIKTKNRQLYEQALTHSSFANENNTESNERLEFLGDAVIELLMSEYLYQKKDLKEGEMTKKRAQLVCEEALFLYAEKINLTKYLRLGQGEKTKGPSQATVADTFEALMGAIYLDLGYKVTRKIFYKIIIKNINLAINIIDYKTNLQEVVQSDKRTLTYKQISESGPSHDKTFHCAVYLDGTIILGEGVGKTKKEAEQNAAKAALEKGIFNDNQTNF